MSEYYNELKKVVIASSESDIWELAVKEWGIWDCEENLLGSTSCLCGKENLRYLFTIKNKKNGKFLYPIGSTCIQRFGRTELMVETKVYKDMFKLFHAVEDDEFIRLDSGYFTRKLIVELYEEGAFSNNYHNGYDGQKDCQFLMDMFNKRDKSTITQAQHAKIRAIIGYSIKPFLQRKLNEKIF